MEEEKQLGRRRTKPVPGGLGCVLVPGDGRAWLEVRMKFTGSVDRIVIPAATAKDFYLVGMQLGTRSILPTDCLLPLDYLQGEEYPHAVLRYPEMHFEITQDLRLSVQNRRTEPLMFTGVVWLRKAEDE